MTRAFVAALSIPALLLAAACAPGPDTAMTPRSADTCFLTDRVINFRAGQSPSLYVKARDGSVFELQTTSFCPGAESTNTLVLTPLMGGGSRSCVSDSLSIDVAGMGTANRCTARVVRKLSEEEVAALPSRYRP
ncbi:hypothetical protein [Brevundimonas sp. A19_0]|uniref:hypothetical protein n=1 Tax=Brevundimonas sp. A19_0 TaxID=2821087 RepID=UPI001AD9A679|nr:hypothetical protein [Brevundimonas sp. A19_0]MBO9500194.1 hypothetical protein [Brevundimonas sp. A19_0]